MFDTNNIPMSSSVVVAGLFYTCASIIVLGPLVAERTIENSDWSTSCRVGLKAEIETRRKPAKIIPNTDCKSTIGIFMPELARLCNQYGNPDFGGPMTGILRKQERLRQEAEDRRLSIAASQSGSKCSCAAAVVAQDRSWAIHAGSLRLITPPQVNNLHSELTRALNTSHCTGRG